MPTDDELRAAMRAFDEAGRALLAALESDAPDLPARLQAAEARLRDAQAVLDRLRKRQARP